jgi:hypothetical protein
MTQIGGFEGALEALSLETILEKSPADSISRANLSRTHTRAAGGVQR